MKSEERQRKSAMRTEERCYPASIPGNDTASKLQIPFQKETDSDPLYFFMHVPEDCH